MREGDRGSSVSAHDEDRKGGGDHGGDAGFQVQPRRDSRLVLANGRNQNRTKKNVLVLVFLVVGDSPSCHCFGCLCTAHAPPLQHTRPLALLLQSMRAQPGTPPHARAAEDAPLLLRARYTASTPLPRTRNRGRCSIVHTWPALAAAPRPHAQWLLRCERYPYERI